MTLREQENLIFNDWAQKHDRFIRDGVPNGGTYEIESRRILLLLKEVNSPDEQDGSWDLRQHMADAEYAPTWNNVSRWIKAITPDPINLDWRTIDPLDGFNDSTRREQLLKIAAVNLKKTPGGASSDWLNLLEFVQENREHIIKQLRLYKPHLTICCGTYAHLKMLYSDPLPQLLTTSNGVQYHRDYGTLGLGCVVDYYHPQARFPSHFLTFMLAYAVKEIDPWT